MPKASEAVVVDASVAVKWHLLDEAYAEAAAVLLIRLDQGSIHLLAPRHIRYEVPAAILSATRGRRPRLTAAQAEEAIEEFLGVRLRTVDDNALIRAASRLAYEHAVAFYDALYLALAERLHVPLVTADRRFYERVKHRPGVRWISMAEQDQEAA